MGWLLGWGWGLVPLAPAAAWAGLVLGRAGAVAAETGVEVRAAEAEVGAGFFTAACAPCRRSRQGVCGRRPASDGGRPGFRCRPRPGRAACSLLPSREALGFVGGGAGGKGDFPEAPARKVPEPPRRRGRVFLCGWPAEGGRNRARGVAAGRFPAAGRAGFYDYYPGGGKMTIVIPKM